MLSFELCPLVDVAGVFGRRLIGRRLFDVAKNPDGTRMHNAADPMAGRCFQHVLGAAHIDVMVDLIRKAGLAKERRQVVDPSRSCNGSSNDPCVTNIALNDLHRAKRLGQLATLRTDEGTHLDPFGKKMANEVRSAKTGGSSNKYLHSGRTLAQSPWVGKPVRA
jgi:hypothetical protein